MYGSWNPLFQIQYFIKYLTCCNAHKSVILTQGVHCRLIVSYYFGNVTFYIEKCRFTTQFIISQAQSLNWFPVCSLSSSELQDDWLQCQTGPSNVTAELTVRLRYGQNERRLQGTLYYYTEDPNITQAGPPKSFLG